jgi:hypothetical protein
MSDNELNDIERLDAWLAQRDMSKRQLAIALDMPYSNLYQTLRERPRKTQNFRVNGNLIVRFICKYGIDEARLIFSDLSKAECV